MNTNEGAQLKLRECAKMSDSYKSFVRLFRATAFSKGMSAGDCAAVLGVNVATVYNWWHMRTIMDGDNMLRVVKKIMGGVLAC